MQNNTLEIARQILAQNERLLTLIEADAPAKVTRPKAQPKAAPKAAPKARKAAKPQVKATKGSQGYRTGAGMTKHDWNKTLTTKARLAGGDTYKRVIADWAEVSSLRLSGATPDEVLALFA